MGLLSCCFGGSPAVAPAASSAGTSRSSLTGLDSRGSLKGAGQFWPQTLGVGGLADQSALTLYNLLSKAQQAELMSAFRKFDLNGNGTIDSKELKSVMSQLGHPMTDSQVDNVLTKLDTDRSGCVEWEEFAALMADRWLRADGKVDMNMALSLVVDSCKADEDDDDDISLEEVKKLMCDCGDAPFSSSEWEDFVRAADPGGTGRVGSAAFKQLNCWWAAPPASPPTPKRLSVVRPSGADAAGGAPAGGAPAARQF